MIAAHAMKGKEHVDHLPLWFPAGDASNGTSPSPYGPFTDLAQFNKMWGALGYVPKALNKALDYYGIKDKRSLIAKIAQRVTGGLHKVAE